MNLAIELAEEYGISLWIAALLDPEPIAHGTGSDSHKSIRSPPTYHNRSMLNGSVRSPEKKSTEGAYSTRSKRSASVRSESPIGQSRTPGRPKATPRKPRKARGTLSRVDEGALVEPVPTNGNVSETVKIEVETTTRPTAGGEEEETTKVNVEMPINHPDLPIPNDTQEMLRVARQMVAEAQIIAGPSSSKNKRKAQDMVDEDDEDGLDGPLVPAKRARKMEIELRKERIKRRAVTGIAASLLFGYVHSQILHMRTCTNAD